MKYEDEITQFMLSGKEEKLESNAARTEKNKSQWIRKVVVEIMEECKNNHNRPKVYPAQYFVIDNIQRIECKNKTAHSNLFYQLFYCVSYRLPEWDIRAMFSVFKSFW